MSAAVSLLRIGRCIMCDDTTAVFQAPVRRVELAVDAPHGDPADAGGYRVHLCDRCGARAVATANSHRRSP